MAQRLNWERSSRRKHGIESAQATNDAEGRAYQWKTYDQPIQHASDVALVEAILAHPLCDEYTRVRLRKTLVWLVVYHDRVLRADIRVNIERQQSHLLRKAAMIARGQVPTPPPADREHKRRPRPSYHAVKRILGVQQAQRDAKAVRETSPWLSDPSLLPKAPPKRGA